MVGIQRRLLASTGLAVLITGLWMPAHAQDADDQKRGVARISSMDGEVSVRRGDSGEWVAGVINAPLLTDDRISTGPNSRAEVQFDSANILRLGGTAEVRLAALEYSHYQLELAHGTATYRVLRASSVSVEVDTPNISVRPSKIGIYRISVNEAGETELIVRAGDVEVFSPRGSQWVNAGQMLLARGNTSDPEFQIVAASAPDEWDRWSDTKDRMLVQSASVQYVPQGVYGAEDLDNSGSWVNDPDYGNCWSPNVGADWAPYQNGRWVWEDWYGWTWVSSDSWGWAPYHYGRWFHGARHGWLWYPGVVGVRHYWSPALVAFFGFGGGGGIGFGFGHVGWVPLAPYEVFHPWWGRGYYGRSGFNRSLNITNVNITNVYRNARIRNGISAVNSDDFRGGRFHNMIRPSGNQVRSAGLIRGQMPMSPTNANLRFGDRQNSYVPRSNDNQRFFRHQQPGSVQRVPFAQQRGGEPGGGGNNRPAEQGSRPSGFGQQAGRNDARGPQGTGNGSNGWRRFGSPGQSNSGDFGRNNNQPGNENNGWRGNQSNPNVQNTRPNQPNNGWQRFGEPGGGSRNTPNPGGNYNSHNSPSVRVAPPTVRERPGGNGQNYGGGERNNRPPESSSPRYNNPPSQQRNYNPPSAPRSNSVAPSSPPRSYGGQRGGGGGSPRNFGGGGGGGNSRPSGGGGGGGNHSGGGHGGGRR